MSQNWTPYLHWKILRLTRAVSQSWSWLGTLSVPFFHHYDNRQLLLYIARKSSWHLSARNIGEKFTKNTTTSTKKAFLFGCQQREDPPPPASQNLYSCLQERSERESVEASPLSKEIPKPELAAERHGSSLPPEELAWKATPPIWLGPFQKLPLRELGDWGTSTVLRPWKWFPLHFFE